MGEQKTIKIAWVRKKVRILGIQKKFRIYLKFTGNIEFQANQGNATFLEFVIKLHLFMDLGRNRFFRNQNSSYCQKRRFYSQPARKEFNFTRDSGETQNSYGLRREIASFSKDKKH